MPHDHDHYPVTITLPRSLAEALINALATAAAPAPNDPRLDILVTLAQRIFEMSTTISGQIDDAATRDEAAMAKLSTDLGKIADELKAITPAPGTTVTQAQADRHVAIATALETLATTADALVTTPPADPAPVVFNANDPTPNSPGGRNTPGADPANPMAGFDPSQPITA